MKLFCRKFHSLVLLLSLLLLGGCAQLPGGNSREPPPPIQVPELPQAEANGAIFQSRMGFLPLFEDRRPRRVGDTITIALNEQVNATRTSNSSITRSGNSSLTMEQLPEVLEMLADYGFDIDGSSNFSGGGGARANNTFTGVIAVTVQEVLPNGNLLVRGEKQVVINEGTEFISFTGMVNPRTINVNNTVPSTEVAEARIEYSGDSYATRAQRMGWLQRMFLSVSPY